MVSCLMAIVYLENLKLLSLLFPDQALRLGQPSVTICYLHMVKERVSFSTMCAASS
jgi:hypothetical protein